MSGPTVVESTDTHKSLYSVIPVKTVVLTQIDVLVKIMELMHMELNVSVKFVEQYDPSYVARLTGWCRFRGSDVCSGNASSGILARHLSLVTQIFVIFLRPSRQMSKYTGTIIG